MRSCSIDLIFYDLLSFSYRMFSLADPSGQRTAAVAFRNCLYLIPLGFIAYDCKLPYFKHEKYHSRLPFPLGPHLHLLKFHITGISVI